MTRFRSISFVIPCLDEAESLPVVLQTLNGLIREELSDRDVEIVVADNGSRDGSQEIATAAGARVVGCAVRGYGAALQGGIEAARHDVIVFADADNTYDFAESPKLIARLEDGFDLVLGSRLRGWVEPGAMPWLHRFVGTPVLTFLINVLHGRKGESISDCNSGFRCFARSSFAGWQVEGTGMEFASEMLVKVLKSGGRVGEVPVSLRRDRRDREPHLRTWRDGMRHLLLILSEAPALFFRTGAALLLLSWLVILVGLWHGPVELPGANVFGLHSMMFALLGSLLGWNVFGVGLLLAARRGTSTGPYGALLRLDEGKLFWAGTLFLGLGLALMVSPILLAWWRAGFRFLALEKETLALVAFGANCVFFLFNLVAAHLIKD